MVVTTKEVSGNKIKTHKAIDTKRPSLDAIMNQFDPTDILTAYCPKLQFKSSICFSLISFHSSKTITVKNHWTAIQVSLENIFLFFFFFICFFSLPPPFLSNR